MKFHLWHNWTKWVVKSRKMQYYVLTTSKTTDYIEEYQERTCTVCGYTERKIVK